MTLSVDSVSILGPTDFPPQAVTPDEDGLLQVAWGDGSQLVVADGSVIRGIAVTRNGEAWVPTAGSECMWILRAANSAVSVVVEDTGVPAANRIACPWSWSPFAVGPQPIQIFHDPALSRWRVPNWSPRQIGEVMVYGPAAGEPFGWIEADGSTPLIADYPLLAAALGTTHGGNGTTTFGLPGPGPAPLRWLIFTGGV